MSASRGPRPAAALRGRHRGEEIWIAGSDPSLSEYPDDFFEGKLGMTLHLAHRKFPRASYRYSSEYDRSEHLKVLDPEYRRLPLVAALPMYGKSVAETRALLSDFEEVYFHRMLNYPPTGVRGEVDPRFTERKVRATLAGRARIWGGHGTCLHTAFYMALLMGARAIHLIGAGHGFYKPELEHFAEVEGDHHVMRPGYRSFSDPVEHVPLVVQTLELGRASERLGVSFFWHRTWSPHMDDFIEVDPRWIEEEGRRAERRFGLGRRLYWALWKRPLNRIVSAL